MMKNVDLIVLGDRTLPQERRMKEALKIEKDCRPAAVLDAVKEAYAAQGKKPHLNYAQLSHWRKGVLFYRSPPLPDQVDTYEDLFAPIYQLSPVVVASLDISDLEKRLKQEIAERLETLNNERRQEAERIFKESHERDEKRLQEELDKVMACLRAMKNS